jgi:type I restriction enzyme, S subunit
MSEWRECRLGDLGSVVTGNTPSSKNPEEWGFEMPFVTPSDYKNYGKCAYSSERNLSQSGISRLQKKVLPENSIMVTCIGSDMGKVAMNKTPVITNQQINSIIPKSEIVDSNFLYYRLVSLYETLRIYGSDGTAVPIVNKTDFENIETEIPPLEEQKAIAEVLSSLDDKIDLLHRQNSTLESLAQTLFRQWFIEEAKEEWEITTLGNLGKVITGKTPSTNHEDFWGDSIPFITPTDFKNYNKYAFTAERGLTALGKDKVKNSVLPKDSILVTCIGSDMGKVAITQNECVTNQQINSLVLAGDSFLNEYVFQYLKSIYPLLRAIALGGTTMPIINKTDFENIEIALPSNEILKEFHKTTLPFNEKIIQNTQQIQTLENLRDTLLPKLLSGEVMVEI